MRTIEYHPEVPVIHMIDQRLLPGKFEVLELRDLQQVVDAIRDMAVRGAPAIGITAAFGLALTGRLSQATTFSAWEDELHRAAERLLDARPTAVNLRWAIERMISSVTASGDKPLQQTRTELDGLAQAMADEDVAINRQMADHGAALLKEGSTVIHHCNTGALAAVDYGTALGVIRHAHESGKAIHVLVDETRPRLQGARLTAWELERYGVSYDLIADNAAGFFLQHGEVDAVLVGADRVAANGDVANKIGTYMLALAAHASSVPFYCVAPRSTFDEQIKHGNDIPIEERSSDEVICLEIAGKPVVPQGATARNPAFDITPNHLITAFVTEFGVLSPPFMESIQTMLKKSRS